MQERKMGQMIKQATGLVVTVQVAVSVLVIVENPPTVLFTALLILGVISGTYTALSVVSELLSSDR